MRRRMMSLEVPVRRSDEHFWHVKRYQIQVLVTVNQPIRGIYRRTAKLAFNRMTLPSRSVVRFYNKRGTAEQWIKEGKQATHWTRLSCHRFRANEVRLQLSVLATTSGTCVGGWRCPDG